jgi:hypothetical protein
MSSRLRLLAVLCVVSGAIVSGCGSSSSSKTTSSSTTSATSTVPVGTTTSQLKAAEAANPAVAQAIAAAVARCKATINAQASLSAVDKGKLDAICQQAGNGDADGVQVATAKVCQEIVRDTVPASSQAYALAACPKP